MSVAGNGKEDAPRPDVREDGQEQSCTCGVILRTIEGALRDNRWQPLGTAYDEPPSCPVHSARPYELRPMPRRARLTGSAGPIQKGHTP